jgi:hypothetical protein
MPLVLLVEDVVCRVAERVPARECGHAVLPDRNDAVTPASSLGRHN